MLLMQEYLVLNFEMPRNFSIIYHKNCYIYYK